MSQKNFVLGSVLTIQADATVSAATAATPIAITTSAAHGLNTGDIVKLASVGGNTAANGQWVITKTSSTAFTLNNSVGNAAYTSGGTVKHIGTSADLNVDNTVFTSAPDFTLLGRFESISAGNARMQFVDAVDTAFVSEQPLGTFQQVGPIASSYDVVRSFKKQDVPDARIAASGNTFRAKVFLSGAAGTKATWSAWLVY